MEAGVIRDRLQDPPARSRAGGLRGGLSSCRWRVEAKN